jgi:predicted phosphodiesterase/pyruvate-formate lyase-activating enzyme
MMRSAILIAGALPMGNDAVVRMDGPVLAFGGPYSNLEATRAVLVEARRRAIPSERILCTGDVVAYGADAGATVALIRSAGIRAIMGNCEESLAAGAADCGCGYAEGSACDRLASEWYRHADRSLDREARLWMASLPRRLVIEVGGRRLAVIHGGARRINRFVFASTPAAIKRTELAAIDAEGVIAGHCGIPFTQVIDGKLWHNAGAIGLPANDGTPRLWFSLLAPTEQGLRIEHLALAYDHDAAAAKMRACFLPEGYAAALHTGRWPSLDVLPQAEIAATGTPIEPGALLWTSTGDKADWPIPSPALPERRRLDPDKFRDPAVTATGERRARVALEALKTLWFNTGTLCNIACAHCYIESSPRNDRLAYLTLSEMQAYLDEIRRDGLPTEEIGFTGGEPFMNPDILPMLEACLAGGFRTLVLTNAMRPMQRLKAPLLDLQRRRGRHLTIRVSLDHYTAELHEEERGAATWRPTVDGLVWLARNGFTVSVAGRLMWGETETSARQGYAQFFAERDIDIDADDPASLVLFPEMDAGADVPEITESCWGSLHRSPNQVMCATSRMVVRRRDAERPAVVACTLLPYDPRFELGATLADAAGAVALNHPHCAKFCVLGGGSCSRA